MARDSWDESAKFIGHELQRLSDSHEKLCKDFNINMLNIQLEIARLKIKAGVWGLLAGLVPVVIVLAIEHLKK